MYQTDPKPLKRHVVSLGNKNLSNQASSPSSQVDLNGNKISRIDATSSVRIGNLA